MVTKWSQLTCAPTKPDPPPLPPPLLLPPSPLISANNNHVGEVGDGGGGDGDGVGSDGDGGGDWPGKPLILRLVILAKQSTFMGNV